MNNYFNKKLKKYIKIKIKINKIKNYSFILSTIKYFISSGIKLIKSKLIFNKDFNDSS